jgi:hypothetical protein
VVVAVSTLVGGQALYLVLEDLPQIVHALRRVLANEHNDTGEINAHSSSETSLG